MAEMTNREFLNEVAEVLAEMRPDLAEFATAQVAKLDQKNEARKSSKAVLARQAEGAEIATKVMEYLSACGGATAEVIASEIGAPKGKVVYQLTALANEGKVEKSKAKSKDPYVYSIVADVE